MFTAADQAGDSLIQALGGGRPASPFESSMRLSEDVGQGAYTKMTLRGGMEMVIVDLAFHRPVFLPGMTASPGLYGLMFCLEGSMRWNTWQSGREYVIEADEHCFMDAEKVCGRSFFPEGGGIRGFGVTVPAGTLEQLLHFDDASNRLNHIIRALRRDALLHKKGNALRHTSVIHDLLCCRLSGNVRQLYLESKILELLALYLDEFLFENNEIRADSGLDAAAMERLRSAKAILDADIANAPSLAALSRMVNLNEFKLKNGFKKLFGMPVHAYIIDKRLEHARYLLEKQKITVTEAAQTVGYSELGQFAGKFRRKYGVSPSEYLRRA